MCGAYLAKSSLYIWSPSISFNLIPQGMRPNEPECAEMNQNQHKRAYLRARKIDITYDIDLSRRDDA
jgi:hypothetical protein